MAGNFVIREALAIMTDKASSVMFMPGFRTTEAPPVLPNADPGCRRLPPRGPPEWPRNDGLHFAAIDIFAACDDHVLRPVQCRNNHRHPDRRCLQRERNRFGRPRSYLLVAPVSAYYVCATRQQFTVLTVACDVHTYLSNPSASSMRPSMAPA